MTPGNVSPPAGSMPAEVRLLVERGLYVFPITAGTKDKPLVPFSTKASNDLAQVERWAAQSPGCNWGVHTGKSGLVVVDEDNKGSKSGALVLLDLELDNSLLPRTLKVATPSGGFHYYFWGAAASGVDKLGPGLDIKSSGNQYVVAPGSQINGLPYRIVEDA